MPRPAYPVRAFRTDHPWFGKGEPLLIGPDGYPITDADPLAGEQLRLSDWLAADAAARPFHPFFGPQELELQPHTDALLALGPVTRTDLARAAAIRASYHTASPSPRPDTEEPRTPEGDIDWDALEAMSQGDAAKYGSQEWAKVLGVLACTLLDSEPLLTERDLVALLTAATYQPGWEQENTAQRWRDAVREPVLRAATKIGERGPLGAALIAALEEGYGQGTVRQGWKGLDTPLSLQDGWGPHVLDALRRLGPDASSAWKTVFEEAKLARDRSRSAPPPSFVRAVEETRQAQKPDAFRLFVLASLRAYKPTGRHGEQSAGVAFVRGVVWAAAHIMDEEWRARWRPSPSARRRATCSLPMRAYSC